MKTYTDNALKTMQEKISELYIKMAEMKPTDDFSRDDIRAIMYYLKAFQNACGEEQTRREKARREKERTK